MQTKRRKPPHYKGGTKIRPYQSTDDSRRVMTPLVRYRPAIISFHRAGRTNIPMRLLDLDGFVRHYVDVYDKTDEEASDILPLTRIWWPA